AREPAGRHPHVHHLPTLTFTRRCDPRGALSSRTGIGDRRGVLSRFPSIATVGRHRAARQEGGRMWPEGFRCAASFTFDFDAEEGWIGEDPADADKPGVLCEGTYGGKVAVRLILELLATHGLFAAFFFPARGAARRRHPVT